jgi:hypothetical protein
VLEVLADEIESRLAVNEAAGLAGLAVHLENRQIDP